MCTPLWRGTMAVYRFLASALIFYIQDYKEEHITTIRSEAERVIDHTLPVCHPLTEVMGVQHYRSYQALLLGRR